MTTEQLRKEIMVTNWYLSVKGMSISYWRKDKLITWLLPPAPAAQKLLTIGSIDESDQVLYHMNWTEFIGGFFFSQWEALTLAISHELKKETEKEIDNSDIGKAIDKLK